MPLGSAEKLGVEDSNIEEGDGKLKRVMLNRKSTSLMQRF